jgi:hypothetical protein
MFVRDDRINECIKTKGIPFFGTASKCGISRAYIYKVYGDIGYV